MGRRSSIKNWNRNVRRWNVSVSKKKPNINVSKKKPNANVNKKRNANAS